MFKLNLVRGGVGAGKEWHVLKEPIPNAHRRRSVDAKLAIEPSSWNREEVDTSFKNFIKRLGYLNSRSNENTGKGI